MKPDSAFLADLSASRSRVDRFAAMHRSRGIQIWQHPEVVRPSAEERAEFSDDGDMLVTLRLEHKVRGFAFTGSGDFPFPSIIVDEAYKIDRLPRPFVYVIESSDGEAAAVISYRTFSQWSKVRRYDASQRRECEFYEAPLSAVRFCGVGEVF